MESRCSRLELRSLTYCAILAVFLCIYGCEGGGGEADRDGGGHGGTPTMRVAVVFIAAKDVADSYALYAATQDGTAVVKLSGSLDPDADVTTFATSPDGARVAFGVAHNGRSGPQELFVVNTGGGDPMRLSDLAIDIDHDHRYAWSPDSRYLAFIATTGLWTIRADGTESTLIQQGSDALTWSPTGARLAYKSARNLFTVLPDGSGTVRVGENVLGTFSLNYSWASDGSRLAYVSEQTLYTVSPDGTNRLAVGGPVRVVAPGDNAFAHFAWAPDSSRIAYIRDQTVELVVALANGAGQVTVGRTPRMDPGALSLIFSWSPDGTRLAYRTDEETPNSFELYTNNTDGRDPVKVSGPLIAGGSVDSFTWAPDGSRIAYRADQETNNAFELYTNTPDGRTNVKVSGPLVAGGSVGSFSLGELISWKWSPDSSRIAYLADQETNDVVELYTSTPDGRTNTKVSGPLVAGGRVSRSLWSPDGSRLVYCAAQETQDVFELYSASPTGTSTVKISGTLVAGGSVNCLRFQPLN